MKKIFFSLFAFMIFTCYGTEMMAQVSGLSYTLSPYAEQTWTNDRSGIKNGIMGGAMLGMGFGEFVELRGNYARGFGFQTDLAKFGFDVSDAQVLAYTPRDIDFSRYGGELKLNLSKGAFLPYLTLGTGIQSIGYDSLNTSKQIYLNAGLGVKFSAGDRYTIGLQAINSRYNYSAVNSLMDDSEREAYGLIKEEFLSEPISNWALRASLVLYLGGRKPGEVTDIDKAYWDNFSGGFRGLNVPVEFQVSKMNFHEDLPFRDTWMAGGSAGLNFGPLVGVRGFYWRAIEDGTTTSFDDLAMYGAEARFLLNEGKGFTPWLTIGAGNINVGEEYVGQFIDTVGVTGIDSKGFAMGGLGIDLPFSKYVKATGFVRSILTTSQNFEDVTLPEELKSSWNYGVSLNFVLGRNKEKIEVVKQSAFDDYILASDAENTQATQELRNQYEDQIKLLEAQLNQAKVEQDEAAIKEIEAEKAKAEKIVDQLDKNTVEKAVKQAQGSAVPQMNDTGIQVAPYGNGQIRMSPAEFNLLIRDIMDGMQKGGQPHGYAPNGMNQGNQDIQSALSDYKKDQQIDQLTESLAEIKGSLAAITTAQMTLKDENKAQAETMKALVSSMESQVKGLEAKVEKSTADLNAIQTRQVEIENGAATAENIEFQSFESAQLQRDIDFTNEKIDALKDMMMKTLTTVAANSGNGQAINSGNGSDTISIQEPQISNTKVIQTAKGYDNSKSFFRKFKYNGMSGFGGFNVGGNTTFNLGYRLHYQVGDSKLEFVPETFFGFGSPSAFGISANGIYKMDFLTKSKAVVPYAGLGLGFMKVGDDLNADKLTGAWNFIIGTSLNVFAGDLYVDLTARNSFKYNQLIVGYRFPF